MRKLFLAAFLLFAGPAFAGTGPRNLDAIDTFPPTDGECATFDLASGRFEWQSCGDTITGASVVIEGATPDAFETTLTVTDPTADRTVTFSDIGGTGTVMLSTLATNGTDVANSVWSISNNLAFEGASADGFEALITPVDPTVADGTFNLPNVGAAVSFLISTLTTNNIDAANSIWGVSNGIVFEGSGADGNEMTLSPANPGADVTVTIPATTTTLAGLAIDQTFTGLNIFDRVGDDINIGAADSANSWVLRDTNLIFEGSSADANELAITAVNPTADTTMSFPDYGVAATYFVALDRTGAAIAVVGAAQAIAITGSMHHASAGAAADVTTATLPAGVTGPVTVTLICDDANVTFTNGDAGAADTLDLAGNLVCTARDTLTILRDTTNSRWVEVARSIN